MGALSAEERPIIGQVANDVRAAIESVIEEKQAAYQQQETENRLCAEMIDVTLPGRPSEQGAVHPLSKVIQEIEDILSEWAIRLRKGQRLSRTITISKR